MDSATGSTPHHETFIYGSAFYWISIPTAIKRLHKTAMPRVECPKRDGIIANLNTLRVPVLKATDDPSGRPRICYEILHADHGLLLNFKLLHNAGDHFDFQSLFQLWVNAGIGQSIFIIKLPSGPGVYVSSKML